MSKTLSVNEPAGTASISQGDDQIRSLKQSVVDNMADNHVMLETTTGVYSETENGKHHKVDLFSRESGADYEDVTTLEGYGIIYSFLTSYTTEAGTYDDFELYWAYAVDTETSSSQKLRLTRAGNIDLDNGSLTNDTGLRARNFADTADIELIKADENDNRLIPGNLVIAGSLEWDEDTTYGYRAVATKTDDTQGECIYISLISGNVGNDPSDPDNQYGEDDASNPVWERLLKRRDLPDARLAGSGLIGAYGAVTSGGSIASAGSDNWSVGKTATGRYKLNITAEGNWMVFASVAEVSSSNTCVINTAITSGYFANNTDGNIHIESNGGTNYDQAWYFIAYRVS